MLLIWRHNEHHTCKKIICLKTGRPGELVNMAVKTVVVLYMKIYKRYLRIKSSTRNNIRQTNLETKSATLHHCTRNQKRKKSE